MMCTAPSNTHDQTKMLPPPPIFIMNYYLYALHVGCFILSGYHVGTSKNYFVMIEILQKSNDTWLLRQEKFSHKRTLALPRLDDAPCSISELFLFPLQT
jgi:hypothetical protein